jgi:hypothetical protein
MTISINKPCHENWAEMTPNQQGAFCRKCLKTVVDFSAMSVSEIKNFFNTTPDVSVCGRFEREQLSDLSFDHFYAKFKGFHFSKRLTIIVCFTFGSCLFENNNAFAQTKPKEHLKGDLKFNHEKRDTIKNCVKFPPVKNMIMGKVLPPKKTLVDTVNINEHYIMGESYIK